MIYRVENKNGRGCYRDSRTKKFLVNHLFNINHPSPENDKNIQRKVGENEICGFLNLKQALKWFTLKELYYLKKLGYRLKKIKVSEITVIGKTQVLAMK